MVPHGLVITTLEYPSIMNMMAFLKNVLLRAIQRSLIKNTEINDMLCELFQQPMTNGQVPIREIQKRIADVDSDAGSRVEALCKKYRPRIVFNMGDHPDEIKVADKINGILRSILSMEADYFGFLFHDPNVRSSIKKHASFIGNYGHSVAAHGVRQVAERIVKFMDKRVNDSARLLLNATWRFYEDVVCDN
ncbi:MAG: hypothetical protein JRJ85_05900 [Deltaproteobacteria bacterium]|nr:hypothetical protein [Deltaproteobacteria bacterium]